MTETQLFERLSIYAAGALVLTVMSKFLGYDQQYIFMITGVGYVLLGVACGAACLRREGRGGEGQVAILRVGAILNLIAGGVALAHWFAVNPAGVLASGLTTDGIIVGAAILAQNAVAMIAVVLAFRTGRRKSAATLIDPAKS